MNASENKTAKREGYLFWDDYFMAVASLTAMRSKDPSSQVNMRFCPAILPQDELSASGNVISISGFTVTGWLARKVGACIVNAAKKIVGVGYNGMPHGCSDDDLPWAREADNILDTKYLYVCHAEMNAICNKNCADLVGCTIYVDLFPCNECAKLIIQTRIKEVVYLSDKYADMPNVIASKRLFDMAGVKYRQHHPALSEVVIDFNKINSSPKISDAK